HFAVELKALPAASGIVIRYTTDASSPTANTAATYDGPITVPKGTRMVLAVATASTQGLTSEIVRIQIPQKGEDGPTIDPKKPARWRSQQKLHDSGQVWDFIQKLQSAPGVTAHTVEITAESNGTQQHVEFSGALEAGYPAAALQQLAQQLQDLISAQALRMSVSELAFPTGQALLDWAKQNNHPIDPTKVKQ
ncbi:MAG: chitobiase/beta-hexosaminidase C-terminal domain-containing protein, partial [Planctomycetaceae bacterium]